VSDAERAHALSHTLDALSGGSGSEQTIAGERSGSDGRGSAKGLQLEPGTRIGSRLALERKLGEGGMGEVWAARHTVLDKSVAVKFLLDRAYANVEAEERFLREARAAAGLHHANIVDVHDFGNTADGTPYLVMELLNGQTLADLLATTGRVEWPVARQWLLQVCAALAFAHKHGRVHRDLKPSNIFLEEHEDGITCKLIDFGLAKIVSGHGSGDPQVTRTGVVLGTPTYMSPEQLRAQDVDHRTDIYSLGCIAYEMLAGTRAFQAASATELAAKHLYEAPELEPLRTGGVPLPFIGIIVRCLQKDAAARFQTVGELRAALEGLAVDATRSPAELRGAVVGAGSSDMSSKPFDPRSRSTVSGLSLASAPVSPWRFRVLVALVAMVVGSLVTWVLVASKGGDTEPAALAEPPAVAPPPATRPELPPAAPVVEPVAAVVPVEPVPAAATAVISADPVTTDTRPGKGKRSGKRPTASDPVAAPVADPPPVEATPIPPTPPVPADSDDWAKAEKLRDPFKQKQRDP